MTIRLVVLNKRLTKLPLIWADGLFGWLTSLMTRRIKLLPFQSLIYLVSGSLFDFWKHLSS